MSKVPSVTIKDQTSGEELTFAVYEHGGIFRIGDKVVQVNEAQVREALKDLNEQIQIARKAKKKNKSKKTTDESKGKKS